MYFHFALPNCKFAESDEGTPKICLTVPVRNNSLNLAKTSWSSTKVVLHIKISSLSVQCMLYESRIVLTSNTWIMMLFENTTSTAVCFSIPIYQLKCQRLLHPYHMISLVLITANAENENECVTLMKRNLIIPPYSRQIHLNNFPETRRRGSSAGTSSLRTK